MLRRSFRWGLWLGLLVGGAWALRRTLLLRRSAGTIEVARDPWTPLSTIDAEVVTDRPPETDAHDTATPEPATLEATPPAPAPPGTAGSRTWMAAQDGRCPYGHPVKAKTASRVFRVPGMTGYEQSRPDRCYRTEEDAVADGFTKARR